MFDLIPTYIFNPCDRVLQTASYCVLDFETTGLSAKYDRLTEFGGAIVSNGMVEGYDSIVAKLDEYKRRGLNRDNPLTPKEENIEKTLQIALEMVERGYKFENIDLYRSDATEFVVDHEHNALIPPFRVVDGLGDAAAESIVEARKAGKFLSKEDLLKRATKLNGTNLNDLSDLHANFAERDYPSAPTAMKALGDAIIVAIGSLK